MVEQLPITSLLPAGDEGFLIRNFSQRLGVLLRPGALAYVDPQISAGDG